MADNPHRRRMDNMTPRADINPEGFLPPPTGCTCGNLYTYGGHTEPGQFHPECPAHSPKETA